MHKDQVIDKLSAILVDITFEDPIDGEEPLSFYDRNDNDQDLIERVEEEFGIRCPMFLASHTVEELAELITRATDSEEP